MKNSLLMAGWLCLQFAALAQPVPRQSLPGHVPKVVANLTAVGRLESGRELKLAIALPLRDKEGLTNQLQRIYDPASPDYHHYLTPAQFAETYGPTEEDYQAVAGFAISNGLRVTATHSNRALLDVSGAVSNIENAFHVTLRTYSHPKETRLFYAPDAEPSVDLATPILHVSGLDNYIAPRPMNLKKNVAGGAAAFPAEGSAPGGNYMGNDFRAAYVPGASLTGAGQTVGLLEFDSGYYQSDVAAYEALANLPAVPVKAILLDGYEGGPGDGNDEVSLDIEMAISLAPGLSSVLVYEGDLTDDILNRMATDGLANQLSASWTYGIDAESEQIFQQFAAQGQSFFNASGDGDAYVGEIATPADDPNLTSVGGTTLTTSGPGGAWVSETVWNWGEGVGGGGGISTTYPIPSWQLGISMVANQGSTVFRNIPDVAMTADNVWVLFGDGASGSFGGTSCATPLWAAFTALANEQAVAAGRPLLGFINPAVYALGKSVNYTVCFHDIVTGNNTWSESPDLFYAVTGYDLCTGWGTPAGTNLINVLAPTDSLQILPLAVWSPAGGVGGPFSPASESFTLTNIGNATLNWAAGANVPWLNISLRSGTLSAGGSGTTVLLSLNAAASNLFAGSYGATVQFTNLTDGDVQSRAVSLAIIKAPVITSQPNSVALIGGTTATFAAVAAGGLPLNCQWQHNGVNLTNSARVTNTQTTLSDTNNYGSFLNTLTISNVVSADGGTYALVASNAAGAAVSSNAVLTFTASAPVILQQPASQTAFVGATVQLAVAVDGNAPFTYQWKLNQTNLTDGGAISGSATAALTITGVSSASIGTYTVVISNAIGSTTSTGAVLTVEVLLPVGQLVQNGGFETGNFSSWNESGNFADCSVSSSSVAVYAGAYGALLGPAGSLGYLSQALPTVAGQSYLISLWLDSPDGLSPNEFLVAWNGTTLFDQTNLGAIGWTNLQFYIAATSTSTLLEFGFQDDESFLGLDNIQVTPLASANGAPIIVTQPVNQSTVTGGGVSFSVLSAGALPLRYQWVFDSTDIAQATNATLSLTNLTTNQAGSYSVLVSNALGSTLSSNALLTVVPGTEEVITFDDLPGGDVAVPDGYHNLTWSNFYYLDGVTYGQPSGYTAGVTSPPNVAYNANGTPAAIEGSGPFTLVSAYLTAAWNDNLRVEVQGYTGSTLSYDNTYTLSATTPTLLTFNYNGITSAQFISSGGTPHSGYDGGGEQFDMDNVTVIMPAATPTTVLYSFNGPDGGDPASALAQGADGNFYGTTEYGGSYNEGTIFKMTTNGVLSTLISFNGANGGYPYAAVVQGADGSLYGTTESGGTNYDGTVFKMTTNGVLTTLHSFDYSDGGYPYASLIQGTDGNLYGTTSDGGANYDGTIFKIATNGTFSSMHSFDSADGSYPEGPLIQGTDGNFYGTTDEGGANGEGTVFKITTNDVLTTLLSFDGVDGSYPSASLTQGADGNFYGTTQQGGYNTYYGTVFRMATNGVLTTLHSFDYYSDGGYPDAGLVQGADGNFYGTTSQGGTYFNGIESVNAFGTLFKITTNGTLTTLVSFAGTNGLSPLGSLWQGADGSFYGTTSGGGVSFNGSSASGDGVVFRFGAVPAMQPPSVIAQPAAQTVPLTGSAIFSVTTGGAAPLSYSWSRNGASIAGATNSTYVTDNVQLADSGSQFRCLVSNPFGSVLSSNAALTVFTGSGPLFSFNGLDGGDAMAAVIQGADGNFYGTTPYGGTNDQGSLFRLTTNGQLTTLVSFSATTGYYPYGSLTQGTDGNFYGTTSDGGSNIYYGTVFRITTNGVLTTLYSFDYNDGEYPAAGLIEGTDGNFYGTTQYGGADGYGTVFKITTNGTLSTLASFNYSVTGGYPDAGLVQGTDGNFYGTTGDGGTDSEGTVFRMTTNGTLTSLFSFNATSGSYPSAALIQAADGNFYGTTSSGGAYNYYGTVFRMTTNGTLTTLHSFDYSDGGYPYAPLMQGADGNLYGTTDYGGTNGVGTLFRITTAGVLSSLYSFAGSNGSFPQSGLAQDLNGNIYCTTASGGTAFDGVFGSGNGVVFRLAGAIAAGPPMIETQPLSQTLTAGASVTFSVSASGSLPLQYRWMRNGALIAGATLSSYVTNNVQLADSGSQFSCLVSNAYGAALSSNATLTVVSNLMGTNVLFVRSSVGDPWDNDGDETALTTVFGNFWQTSYYETTTASAIFSPTNSFIFMEGSDVDAAGMAAFLTPVNLTVISNWVAVGGSLFINAAPQSSDGVFSIGGTEIYFGFGVNLYPDFSYYGWATAPAHPIFNGPYLPVGTAFTGNYFSHASLSGLGLWSIMTNSIGGVSLAETSHGAGHVLFGGMTLPSFHEPQPQAANLLANILSYGAEQAAAAGHVAPQFQSVSVDSGLIHFSWASHAGQFYQVQYTTNLAQGPWTLLVTNIPSVGSTLTVSDSISNLQRFYRIVLLP